MSIVCFGEMLWDVLPTGKQPGRALLNAAVHLHNFGLEARIISQIGPDELGAELLTFIEAKVLSTDYVQRGTAHPTGVVHANVSNSQEVTYQTVQPVAWDYIAYDAALSQLVGTADAFIFGSLAVALARHAVPPAARLR